MPVAIGVLGPVTAWDGDGAAIALKGPRHRAVLARLVVAHGRVVPVGRLVDDLWEDDPPEGAVGAVRTFVAALRRALEPDRPPRTPPRLLVTEGPGYALQAAPEQVDAWRFERAVAQAATLAAADALAGLDEALGWWRGPAYAQFEEEAWARAERSRLAELRLHAVERRAEALLDLGRPAAAVPDLDAHVAEHPWREEGWRLLALALYRSGRQADALALLRQARGMLVEQLGVDPGPRLRELETDVLRQADHLGGPTSLDRLWHETAAAYDRAVGAGARARLESTVGLLRSLAVTGGGGLVTARRQRVAAVEAAEEIGDAELTARVIGAYDVPANWTRADDPEQDARVVAAAERTLARLAPRAHAAARARLLATIALESRGSGSARARAAAEEAEALARRLDDPALLAFALNARWMQTFERTGLAPQRDAIGAELVELAATHGLTTYELLGHLISIQSRAALADFAAADRHAAAVDTLAARHELPLATIFTDWYRALRLAVGGDAPGAARPGATPASGEPAARAEAAYRAAADRLDGAGMPGLQRGLLPLALLSVRLRDGAAIGDRASARVVAASAGDDPDWGPYAPWVRPLLLLSDARREEAAEALRAAPDPPPDLLAEGMWALLGRAALALGDRDVMTRARAALAPAAAELAGAAGGLLSFGPVAAHLDALDAALAAEAP